MPSLSIKRERTQQLACSSRCKSAARSLLTQLVEELAMEIGDEVKRILQGASTSVVRKSATGLWCYDTCSGGKYAITKRVERLD